MAEPLLSIAGLAVSFLGETGEVTPVRDVSLAIAPNSTLAVVGESGSGKSVTSLAVMNLLPKPSSRISAGSIHFRRRTGETVDLARGMPKGLRGGEIAMIFQEPMTSLNPVMTVGEQIAEAVRIHLGLGGRAARARAIEMLGLVEIPDAARRADDYPHHMSGGMRQRVMIALAMSCNPALLIADEPTTALDVTIQAQVLALIERLRRETGMAVMFITHSLGVVAEIADEVAVMYAGRVVEKADVRDLFHAPKHPYSRALLDCLPARAAIGSDGRRTVRAIPGYPTPVAKGCHFAPRCTMATDHCREVAPAFVDIGGRSVACHRWGEMP